MTLRKTFMVCETPEEVRELECRRLEQVLDKLHEADTWRQVETLLDEARRNVTEAATRIVALLSRSGGVS